MGVPDNIQADILGFLYGHEQNSKKSTNGVEQPNDEDGEINDEDGEINDEEVLNHVVQQPNNKKNSFIRIQSSKPKQYETVLSNMLENIKTMPSRSEKNSSSSSALGGRRKSRRILQGRSEKGRKKKDFGYHSRKI